jgi:glycyl-tRNA synthetase beta chain
LKEHFIVLDHTERRERIVRSLELHARRLGGRVQLKEHAALIDEVADLVEFPGVVAGFFDPAFLRLPEEVLVTTLVHHQHYFPVVSDKGELKEAFLAVVNTQPQDERLIAKNTERVVTARLRDASFFWESDRKIPLEARLERLHTLLFHKKLGSYRDKALRIERLAERIATDAFGLAGEASNATRAARLAKADLTSDMVFEFPELQGTMGGIYAREQGLPEPVWKAIYFHYLPIAVEADAPPSREQLGGAAVSWAAVSLADKLDTVVGLLGAGEKVTGSRDPFGLRRQMHGIVRILMDLPELTGVDRELDITQLAPEAQADVIGFAVERVRYALEQRGFPIEVVRSATSSAVVSPLRARRVAEALQAMRSSPDFQALAVLFKRVKNIARERTDAAPLDPAALTEPAERALLDELASRRPRMAEAIASADYKRAFSQIAGFRPAVDRFFNEVFVMVEDPRVRGARLALMAELRDLILGLADISEIVPQTE